MKRHWRGDRRKTMGKIQGCVSVCIVGSTLLFHNPINEKWQCCGSQTTKYILQRSPESTDQFCLPRIEDKELSR